MAAKDTKPADDGAKAKEKKGGPLKLILIVLALLLMVGGGVGGTWYFMKSKLDAAQAQAQATADAAGHEDADADGADGPVRAHKPKSKDGKEPDKVFASLDPFTTNLADESGDRVAQIVVVLELEDAHDQERVSKRLPIVRDQILKMISSQRAADLLSIKGKNALAEEIAVRTGMIIGWRPAEPVAEIGAPKATPVANTEAAPRKRRREEPNPVVAVHFGQFIIQ